jgi:uncharacterized membrane protein
MRLWLVVAATIAGCYLLKLAGYLLPRRVLDAQWARRLVELLPVALLAALVVVEAIADGQRIDLDAARLAGLGAGAIAVALRAPFLVVVVTAGAVAGILRQILT